MSVPAKFRPGGLMRCCVETLREAMWKADTPPKEGDTLTCKYCGSKDGNMIFHNDAWEWNSPRSATDYHGADRD